MKHTPGPWRADASNARFAVNTDALHIAMVNIMRMPINEARANALLIAAAPAMYEALEGAPHFDKQSVGQFLREYREWSGNMRQTALAAARGES